MTVKNAKYSRSAHFLILPSEERVDEYARAQRPNDGKTRSTFALSFCILRFSF
jgi:hypothetical protein